MLLMRCLAAAVGICLSLLIWGAPAEAAIDPYVARYLDAAEPVLLSWNQQGEVRSVSGEDLSDGIRLFEENCKNCHVGGATLPDPTVSLSLEALQNAVPPRDNISSLVAYLRQPMTYDGTEETFWCRQIAESWLSQDRVEHLAAFVLRAAQKAPGWGNSEF